MMMDDVIEIKVPDQDSQWRLRPCKKCKGDNVAYVHYNGRGGAKWRVQCFDCGHTVDKGNTVRHDAQVNWNEACKAVPTIPKEVDKCGSCLRWSECNGVDKDCPWRA